MVRDSRRKLTLILGSGFSCEAKLPPTSELSSDFVDFKPDGPSPVDAEISKWLRKFWVEVFAYADGGVRPSLEEHFTVVDLAANSGHHVGSWWSPKKLRAIRRMSIHRVFQILDSRYRRSQLIADMLTRLNDEFDMSVVTLNWDIVLEMHLPDSSYDYQVSICDYQTDGPLQPGRIRVLKPHGSSSWVYCDSCRQLLAERDIQKTALHKWAYLEADDFEFLESAPEVAKMVQKRIEKRRCPTCGNPVAGRIATFSYRKFFAIPQLQTIWERAFQVLREATEWVFIGYSMPAADFEFKHLLKSAQLARQDKGWKATVVLKCDEDAANRYKGFFGLDDSCIFQCGLKDWAACEMPKRRRTKVRGK